MCFLLLRVIDLRGFSDLRWLCLRLWKWPVWKCWMLQISLKHQGSHLPVGFDGMCHQLLQPPPRDSVNSEFASCSWPSPGSVFLFGFLLRQWAKALTSVLLHQLEIPWPDLSLKDQYEANCQVVFFTLMLVSTLVYVCEDKQTWTSASVLSGIVCVQERWQYCDDVFFIPGIPGWNVRLQLTTAVSREFSLPEVKPL